MARKTYECDCCGKRRNNLIAVGRDYNGDPDSPEICFFCRKQWELGKVFDKKINKYIYSQYLGEY